jgi:hypothetical protein
MNYLHALTSKNSSILIPIKVVLMTLDHAVYWDRVIQPRIRATGGRADRLWLWTFFRTVLVLAQQVQGRRAIGLVTMLRADNGSAVPAAMTLLIDPYFDLGSSPSRSVNSTFVWFLASAPSEVLGELGVSEPPSLGTACLDNALVYSKNNGWLGKIGLHCAVEGGQRLFEFYKNRKLILLPQGIKLPVRRANDGRFFYTNESLANQILNVHSVDRFGRKLRA